MPPTTLLEACMAALSRACALEEGGRVRVHTVFSRPRPVRSLYPLAHIHASDAQASHASDAPIVYQEHLLVTASYARDTPADHNGDAADAERLMYALEAYVYTLPTCGAGVLYVSKLDSTGYGPKPARGAHLPEPYQHAPSIASALTAAVVAYFAARTHWRAAPHITHVSVHVLARAQAAYLFPSSPAHPAKHVLSDAALIRWWQACLSDALAQVRTACPAATCAAHYLLPGYSRLDAHPLVPLSSPDAPHAPGSRGALLRDAHWVYGHPYSHAGAAGAAPSPEAAETSLPSLPLHACADELRTVHGNAAQHTRSLATLVPVFPDDPKGRFLNELCASAHEPGKRTTGDGPGVSAVHREAMAERQVLDRTPVDQFWETMGFRQECASGNAVGVFVISVAFCRQAAGGGGGRADAPGGASTSTTPPPPAPVRTAPPAQPCALPDPVLEELVLKHLLRDTCHWADPAQAVHLTRQFYQALDRATQRKVARDPSTLAGEAVLWSTSFLPALPAAVRAAGKRAADAHGPTDAPAAAPVRVLSVKRKRRS